MPKDTRFVKRTVVTEIPARREESFEEVDTLKEFLKEVELTEENVRSAIAAYKLDKVAQPTYKMDDVLKAINTGVEKAQAIDKGNDNKVEVENVYTADALQKKFGWTTLGKFNNPSRYILKRG